MPLVSNVFSVVYKFLFSYSCVCLKKQIGILLTLHLIFKLLLVGWSFSFIFYFFLFSHIIHYSCSYPLSTPPGLPHLLICSRSTPLFTFRKEHSSQGVLVLHVTIRLATNTLIIVG